MKATVVDRALVLATATASWAWVVCVTMLWPLALNASGRCHLVIVAASLASLGVGFHLPGWIARAAACLMRRGDPGEAPRSGLASMVVARDDEGARRAMARLLALASLAVALGGVASGAATYLAARQSYILSATYVWSGWSWTALQAISVALGMLPVSLGMGLLFRTGTLIRATGGQDACAPVARDWLWALAGAMAIVGAAWGLGMNLLGVLMMMTAALACVAIGSLVRRRVAVGARPIQRPVETPSPVRRWSLAPLSAGMAGVVLVQLRVGADVFGAPLGARLGWLAATAALLAIFLARLDRRRHVPSRFRSAGSAIGIGMVLLMQLPLAGLSLRGGALGGAWVVLALAGQVPLCALAATMMSRSRRVFASSGGRDYEYASHLLFGGALGTAAYLGLWSLPAAGTWLVAGGMAVLAGGVVVGIFLNRPPGGPIGWATAGIVLIGASTWFALRSRSIAAEGLEPVAAGSWLTTAGPGERARLLPVREGHRGEAVEAALREVVGRMRGHWLLVGGPSLGTDRLPALLETESIPWDASGAKASRFGSAHMHLRLSRGQIDGVFLRPPPPDHPQAWRCVNARLLRSCVTASAPRPRVIVRLDAPAGRPVAVLEVVRTLREVASNVHLVAEVGPERIDALILAGGLRPPPGARSTLAGVRDEIFTRFEDVRPIRVFRSQAAWWQGPGREEFADWLGGEERIPPTIRLP